MRVLPDGSVAGGAPGEHPQKLEASTQHRQPPMPAKAMCPDCGQKSRGNSHLCSPDRVTREQKRQATLAKLAQK